MPLTNPNNVVTEQRLSEFYQAILPYIGGYGFKESDPFVDEVIWTGSVIQSGQVTFTNHPLNYDAIYFNYYIPHDGTDGSVNCSTPLIVPLYRPTVNNYVAHMDPTYGSRSITLTFTEGVNTATLLTDTSESSGSTRPAVVAIHGVRFVVSTNKGETVQIENGDGTLSRTFSFSNAPKFVSADWHENSWHYSGSFSWGSSRLFFTAHNSDTALSGVTVGVSSIAYGVDGKSFTVTGGNVLAAINSENVIGTMFTFY